VSEVHRSMGCLQSEQLFDAGMRYYIESCCEYKKSRCLL
jgi:hypothetical protein